MLIGNPFLKQRKASALYNIRLINKRHISKRFSARPLIAPSQQAKAPSPTGEALTYQPHEGL
jgi:hypothetical protein